MIALLVMTDGRRQCISKTVPSFLDALDRPDLLSELWIHDDSGDPEYRAWLHGSYGHLGFRIVGPPAGRSGFGGAIRSAWATLRAESSARFVFHLEDDFTFNRTVDLGPMVATLDHEPDLVQLALRRQPWNESERAAGGIVEQFPNDFHERTRWEAESGRFSWLEHRRFFTTNPCLYRLDLVHERDWPTGPESEGRFGIGILNDHPRAMFAYWGSLDSGEAVHHVGDNRVGTGY